MSRESQLVGGLTASCVVALFVETYTNMIDVRGFFLGVGLIGILRISTHS